jgi:uncharacterized protein (TIGR02231 family)
MKHGVAGLTIVVLSGAFGVGFCSDRTIADSRIIKVTAFTDRALVTRMATIALKKGDQEIRFADLPALMERNSVQASGRGNAIIRDVRFGQEQMVLMTDLQLQKLIDQRDSLNDSVRIIEDLAVAAQNQKNFIENIAKKVTAPAVEPEKTAGPELDPAKWSAMVGFYRKSIGQLNEEIRKLESTKKNLGMRIDRINRQIDDRGAGKSKTNPYVDVIVHGKEVGSVELELSYIADGVSWTPTYTLRMGSNAKTMNVLYNAMVKQNTGEDWNGVALNLSTATPVIGGIIPRLMPWYVDVVTPRYDLTDAEMQSGQVKNKSFTRRETNKETMSKKAEAPEPEMVAESAPAPAMIVENSTVEKRVYSAVYALAGAKDIASDNQEHLVAIASFDLPAELSYSSVPKLQPAVFLNAKITNATDYTLLPGATSVFFENSFVANGNIDLVAPAQAFETPLGTDEQMHIERKQVNRFQKEEGLLSKRNKLIYTYSIIIKNNKKSDETVIVKDQIPVSRNQDIVVTYVPLEKKSTVAPLIDKSGIVEWRVFVKAGQELAVPFSFSVEYPKEMQVDGL